MNKFLHVLRDRGRQVETVTKTRVGLTDQERIKAGASKEVITMGI